MSTDKLRDVFCKRESFMLLIKEKYPETYTSWPVDISEKNSQVIIRETALKGVEEMFEALGHLKNWKPHRQTEFNEGPDREEFLEEIVDALNYFFSLIITAGFDEDDLIAAYIKKHDIIIKRIEEGY